MAKRRRVPDIGTIVVAVVGAVGQIEGLTDDLQIVMVAELYVLGESQVQLKERIAAKGIVLGNRATLRNAVDTVEAVLRCG